MPHTRTGRSSTRHRNAARSAAARAVNLLLHFEEQPGQRLLVNHRIAPTGIGGHIVYILDENEVGIHLVQVLNQRSVTGRTEQKRTVAVPERRIVRIHGYRIGRAFLYRHGDIVLHTEPLAVLRKRGIEHPAEIAGMFGRYGKMHRHPAPARRILRPLGQVSSPEERYPNSSRNILVAAPEAGTNFTTRHTPQALS